MTNFKHIAPSQITENNFSLIGTDWMLVTAKGKDNSGETKVNTMTASWGGTGIMWGVPVAFIFIRPQRYTKEFLDNQNELSLTFFTEEHKQTLGYLGKVSGRDEDKIAKSKLTLAYENNIPYFTEGKLVMTCKKLFAQPLAKDSFLDPAILEKWYPNEDYHTMYVAQITDVMVK